MLNNPLNVPFFGEYVALKSVTPFFPVHFLPFAYTASFTGETAIAFPPIPIAGSKPSICR